MRNLHSFFEILKFPIEVIFISFAMMCIGNLITNPALGLTTIIHYNSVQMLGDVLLQTGRFLIVNFPLLIMIRMVARKGGAGITFISCFAGLSAFLVATIFFGRTDLPTSAYSQILGLSVNTTSSTTLTSITRYPYQMGLIGIAMIVMITLLCYNRSKKKNEFGFFGFISKEASCTLRTVFFCFIVGFIMSFVWGYVVDCIQELIHFISVDTTNPINLTLFGVLDGLLSTLGLGGLIRQPFWYGTSGGTWVNVAGASMAGDVNIWSSQVLAGNITGISGRFITPYYILNIFAIPGLIWGLYSLYTDPIDKRRKTLLVVIATVFSMIGGTLLPVQLMLLFLCPLLFIFHLGYTGILFGVLQVLHCYLGYSSTSALVMTALPGTLPELLTYLKNPSLHQTILILCIVGFVTLFVYFFTTRLYFTHGAIDLFNTGDLDRVVSGTIKAVGGISNIKMVQSTIYQLTVQVYDPSKVDVNRLKRLGSYRVYETRAGFRIGYGASSTMVRIGIGKAMRDSIRTIKTVK